MVSILEDLALVLAQEEGVSIIEDYVRKDSI